MLNSPSEIVIAEKNFSNDSEFGKLISPSDIFFNVCKIHIKVFVNIYNINKNQEHIKEFIKSKCVTCTGESDFSSWFDENDECYSHNMLMLDKLIRVLLYKHCK